VWCTTVLFDLDGTLTDSEPGIVASYRHTLAAFGREADTGAIRRCIGPPLPEGLAALGIPSSQVDRAVAVYRSYFGTTGMYQNRLFDGVVEMVSSLRSAGVTLGLATSKLQRFADAILDHFGIAKYFAVVVGASGDDTRSSKEAIVDFALESLDRPDPATVALVGDRQHDVGAARHHGLHAIGVAWGYGGVEELRSSGSEAIVGDPASLTRLILAGRT
jgi:phosphoglycolate phosphatase